MEQAYTVNESEFEENPIEPPEEQNLPAENRLWIGNLDSRLTQYSILKLLQKFGELEDFDFVIHKSGQDSGKPKGYCFVTYKSEESFIKAQKNLNGKMALSKRLIVQPAQCKKFSTIQEKSKECSSRKNANTDTTIAAIEAKLGLMEKEDGNGETCRMKIKRKNKIFKKSSIYNH